MEFAFPHCAACTMELLSQYDGLWPMRSTAPLSIRAGSCGDHAMTMVVPVRAVLKQVGTRCGSSGYAGGSMVESATSPLTGSGWPRCSHCCRVTVGAALPCHTGDAAGLASQADRPGAGIHRATPACRAPAYSGRAEDAGAALAGGEPAVGSPHNLGRAGPVGASDRAVRGVNDPALGRRRPSPARRASDWTPYPPRTSGCGRSRRW